MRAPSVATPVCGLQGLRGLTRPSTSLVVYRSQTGSDGHGVSLPPVDPSQLLEFTFALVPEPPQPLSINYDFVDYDISSVDQVYLPVAMDPLNNPYIGYIGRGTSRRPRWAAARPPSSAAAPPPASAWRTRRRDAGAEGSPSRGCSRSRGRSTLPHGAPR
jgi:hypothetical protein